MMNSKSMTGSRYVREKETVCSGGSGPLIVCIYYSSVSVDFRSRVTEMICLLPHVYGALIDGVALEKS